MAEERSVVVRFVGKDDVSAVSNKVNTSITKVGATATKTSGGLGSLIGTLSGVAGAAGMTGGAMGSLAGAVGALGGPVGLAVAGVVGLSAALWSVADGAAKTYNQVDNLRKGVVRLAQTRQEGEALYSTLLDIAARTPFERQDVIEMGRALLNAGVAAREIPTYINAIGNAVSTIGGGAQQIDSVTTAIGRMQMSNKLSYEQMVQIQENGIPVFELLAQATGRSAQEIMKLSQDGLLPAEQNLNTLISAMEGKYGNAMSEQIGTATQASSNLGDAWQDLSSTFGDFVEPAVVGVYDALTWTTGALTNAGKAAYDFFAYVSDAVGSISLDAWTATTDTLRGAWIELAPAVQNAWDWVGLFVRESQTVENITSVVQFLKQVWDSLPESISNAIAWTKQAASDTFTYVDQSVKNIPLVGGAWSAVKEAVSASSEAVVETGKVVGAFVNDAVNGVTTIVNSAVNSIEDLRRRGEEARRASFSPNDTYIGMGVVIQGYKATTVEVKKATEATALFVATSDKVPTTLKKVDTSLRDTERATSAYQQAIGSLRHSYMDIADAERSVADAQKALRDAMDPLRIQQMTLSIQSQQISMRELNASMDEMRSRRDEIAKALRGMNDAQIRQNALTAEERRQMQDANKGLREMQSRRDAIRKALAGGKLTDQQRIEFLQTEQALTDAIADKNKVKQDLQQKQDDAVKKAQEERLALLEEDKRLQADLEKSQLRAKQAIIDMQIAQKQLAEAQDPKRLEAYRDAVTKAQTNLAELRLEQEQNRIKADELAASLGITSGSLDALKASAADTATPLDDVAIGAGEVSDAIDGVGGANATVTTLSGNMRDLGDDSDEAVSGLTRVQSALQKIQDMKLTDTIGKTLSTIGDGVARIADSNIKFTDDNLSAPLGAVRDVAKALDPSRAMAMGDWSRAYTSAVNASSDVSKVRQLVNALVALKNTTIGTSDPLPYDIGGGRAGRSSLGMPMLAGAGAGVQNITINLNYASPPSSATPLKDVEDYLAAQRGRLRI